MKKDTITYNYWIYIFTCLFFVLLMRTFKFTDVETKWQFAKVSYSLLITFLSSSLSWLIGKKYNLHYFWICGLGLTGLIILGFLKLLFTEPWAIGEGLFIFILGGIGTLFLGGAIIVISFPFQFLYFKMRQSFKKLV